jgi:large subunit ribosomal protein L29
VRAVKVKEMRDLSVQELSDEVTAVKKKLFELRMAKALHKLENPMEIPAIKNQIAQLKTVIREKELDINK